MNEEGLPTGPTIQMKDCKHITVLSKQTLGPVELQQCSRITFRFVSLNRRFSSKPLFRESVDWVKSDLLRIEYLSHVLENIETGTYGNGK